MSTTVGAVTANAAAITTSAGVPQFSHGIVRIQRAAGMPKPPSGQEAGLLWGGSWVAATVAGSGQVAIGVRGTYCQGYPRISVSVDGKTVAAPTITTSKVYGPRVYGPKFAQGSHMVKVQFVNDFKAANCDRNIYVTSISFTPTAATPPVTPGAANTGIPAGTHLTVHQGDLTITKPGTVVNAMDIRGYVYVRANDVTISNSLIRGGAAATADKALIASWWGNSGLLVEDSTLRADNPSLHIDGISGAGYTASRLNISGVVDTAKVIGSNVTIEDSWMHNTLYSSNDPNHSDGVTHDDNIQVEGGSSILIQGNLLEDAHNSAIMVTQNYSATANLSVSANILEGGACTVNVSQQGAGTPIKGMSITGNHFGPGHYGTTCPIRVPATSPVSISANLWLVSGNAAKANLF